jgi:acetate---CoA ligase (ADP-forming) subunit beta
MVGNITIVNAKKHSRTFLTEVESKDILRESGISVVETKLAKTRDEAISLSKQIKFPVVLKIASLDIVHKSDVGGVKVGLNNETEVGAAYDDIIASVQKKMPQAVIQGVAVQNMARSGVDIIIGMSKDPQFGPVVMFGLGGTLVEILKDVSFRLVPLMNKDAREMIKEVKGYTLLTGYRGSKPCDIKSLESLLLQVSQFVENNPDIKEMDLNPVIVYEHGLLVVDARIILEN